MDIYASDAEQAEAIKKWWRENGKSMVGGVVIGLGGVFGWQSWVEQQDIQKGRASHQYDQITLAIRAGKLESAIKQDEILKTEYEGSIYTLFSALNMARLKVESGDIAGAKVKLELVFNEATDESIRQIARLRLVRLHLAEGKLAEAETLLTSAPDDAFEADLNALRGDLALKRQDISAARTAYRAALEGKTGNPAIIQLKLDSLGATDS